MDIEDALDRMHSDETTEGEHNDMEVETLEDDMVLPDDLIDYSAGEDEQDEEGYHEIDEESFMEEEEDEVVEQITKARAAVMNLANSSTISIRKVEPKTSTPIAKIAPKPASIVKKNANGQFVLVQNTRSSVPVKLLNSSSGQTPTTPTASYHLVKSPDGNLVQMTKSSPTVQQSVKKVVTSNIMSPTKTKYVVKTPATQVVLNNKLGTPIGTNNKTTMSMAQAQQMGLLTPKLKQMISTISNKNAAISTTATKPPLKILPAPIQATKVKIEPNTTTASGSGHLQSKVVFQHGGKTIITKTVTTPSTQKLVVPQHVVKSGQQTGQIQAINIPGKGVQYVRFINPTNKTLLTPKVEPGIQQQNNPVPTQLKRIVPAKPIVMNNMGIKQFPPAPNRPVQPLLRKAVAPVVPLGKQLENLGGPTKLIAVVKKDDNSGTEAAKITTLTTSQLSQLQGATILPGTNKTKIVMLPSDYMQQLARINQNQNITITSKSSSPSVAAAATTANVNASKMEAMEIDGDDGFKFKTPTLDADAYKKRACNCTKSQCLKLYCDCFANGEFCYNCNCKDCFNNMENEEERQKAIRATLERNPSAFKPKIGATIAENDMLRRHTKGCNCKRSGCLKNYCECYEAKIVCSGNCKCVGCRNVDSNIHQYGTYLHDPNILSAQLSSNGNAINSGPITMLSTPYGAKRSAGVAPDVTPLPPYKQPYNFMTPDVIEATVQCMIAQADECQKRGCSMRTSERMILEEFGRCLVEIIDFSSKNEN